MAKKKKNEIPIVEVPKNATPRQIYALCKEQSTADDLAKFLQEEPMMPMEQLLAEMEQIHREETAKQQKRRRKK